MITSAGIGSGIDFESIIQASLNAKKAKLYNNRKENLTETISGYGKLESLIDKLKSYQDTIKVESELNVTADKDAKDASLDVEVKQLAKPNTYSQSFSDGFVFSNFEVIIDGQTKIIKAAGDTITDIRDRLIAEGASASVIKKGNENILMIEAEGVSGLGSWTHRAGQEAIVEVNGIELRSKNNTFDNIEGLSFTVEETGNFNIKVTTESNFTEVYNSVINDIKGLISRGELKDGEIHGAGALAGESYATSVLRRVESLAQGNLYGTGLELQKDGTLVAKGEVDTTNLQKLLGEMDYNDDFIVDSLNNQVRYETAREARNQEILTAYETTLRKKYAALDSLIASYNQSLLYLA